MGKKLIFKCDRCDQKTREKDIIKIETNVTIPDKTFANLRSKQNFKFEICRDCFLEIKVKISVLDKIKSFMNRG